MHNLTANRRNANEGKSEEQSTPENSPPSSSWGGEHARLCALQYIISFILQPCDTTVSLLDEEK